MGSGASGASVACGSMTTCAFLTASDTPASPVQAPTASRSTSAEDEAGVSSPEYSESRDWDDMDDIQDSLSASEADEWEGASRRGGSSSAGVDGAEADCDEARTRFEERRDRERGGRAGESRSPTVMLDAAEKMAGVDVPLEGGNDSCEVALASRREERFDATERLLSGVSGCSTILLRFGVAGDELVSESPSAEDATGAALGTTSAD